MCLIRLVSFFFLVCAGTRFRTSQKSLSHTHTQAHTLSHTHTHTRTHTCTHTRTHTHAHTYSHTLTYTHTNTHTHSHTHKHTYTYTRTNHPLHRFEAPSLSPPHRPPPYPDWEPVRLPYPLLRTENVRQHLPAATCTQHCVAVCCSVLQCVAVCCSVLQLVATCCNASHVSYLSIVGHLYRYSRSLTHVSLQCTLISNDICVVPEHAGSRLWVSFNTGLFSLHIGLI